MAVADRDGGDCNDDDDDITAAALLLAAGFSHFSLLHPLR